MQKLSIIVPCYNEEETVDIFYNETSAVLGGMSDLDWEFIFVDDGSKDGTILALRRLAQADSHVRYLSFSRNFGKEAAMYAGLQAARGDFVSIMDVDLQDPPSMLPEPAAPFLSFITQILSICNYLQRLINIIYHYSYEAPIGFLTTACNTFLYPLHCCSCLLPAVFQVFILDDR